MNVMHAKYLRRTLQRYNSHTHDEKAKHCNIDFPTIIFVSVEY